MVSSTQMTMAADPACNNDTVELALDAQALLGECPRWSVREQVLYWVDIAAHTLNRLDPVGGTNAARAFPEPVACFAERQGGGFVLAMRNRFALLDHFDAPLRWLGETVDVPPEGRFNDGRCDQAGRFLAGTIDFNESRGALYRLDAHGDVQRLAYGVRSANGLAFSPDGRRIYWSDTRNHIVRAYPYGASGDDLGAATTFADFVPGSGRPDGAAVDAEGCYWSALYDGGRVVRFAPDGRRLVEVRVPARHVTMLAFGGADLRTVYVTTARQQLAPDELRRRPRSGGIFSFRATVPGLPEPMFAG
jgi:sugar lactone lactonase YvrE